MPELTDMERLHLMMLDAATILVAAVGVSKADELGPEHPREGGVIDREKVPASAYRGAVMALEFLAIAVGQTDPECAPPAQDFEDEVRLLLGGQS